MSPSQLTAWCDARFGAFAPTADTVDRLYDIPSVVMDNHDARRNFGWKIETPVADSLEEMA
jgi:hypothetical protein